MRGRGAFDLTPSPSPPRRGEPDLILPPFATLIRPVAPHVGEGGRRPGEVCLSRGAQHLKRVAHGEVRDHLANSGDSCAENRLQALFEEEHHLFPGHLGLQDPLQANLFQ